MNSAGKFVVIGASAGCLEALSNILPALPSNYPFPVLIVVHLPSDRDSLIAALLNERSEIIVKEAEDKESILPGHAYFAPPDYHMMVERDETISLSVDDQILYSRPSIDVLFESAADALGDRVVGVILTGANNDGAAGLALIEAEGGEALVQDPGTAFSSAMPTAALRTCRNARKLTIPGIASYLKDLGTLC
ncbi:MAG: chemotaxis protein CheB [Micavibrio aeruginosavorus]|uniref:protein-glutamate methylesterase n=1 Tax=Micavibrio aeruginosavorus TaxID=349221 RepID=A0A2W5BFE7_9BACT|nr:MAG: chemotaxis protein CheB [Micavibrio aeruginosavorus]